MSGQLNDLDNDSLLVLYISGELANGEKAAFERRLANEPALAAELEKLRAAQTFCAETIASADATAHMPVGEGVAVRRVSRAMQQWQVDHIRATQTTHKKGLPLPWWSYPVAVAASLIVGFLVWSSRQSVEKLANDPTVNTSADPDQNNGGGGGEELAVVPPEVEFLSGSFGMTDGQTNAGEESPIPPTAVDDPAASLFPTHEETLQ
jgi:anti-sigma factor RsiW